MTSSETRTRNFAKNIFIIIFPKRMISKHVKQQIFDDLDQESSNLLRIESYKSIKIAKLARLKK